MSEVLGKVIMVAMTVTLLGGFGALVLTTVSQDTPSPPSASFTMEPVAGASSVDVRLVSGSTVTIEGSTLRLFVDQQDRTGSVSVVSAATAGRWAPGETLRIALSTGTLAAESDLLFFAADDASGKSIGRAYATVPGAATGTAILQNALSATLSFDKAPLVTDGVTPANATVTVTSTHGLLLVDHVLLDLSPVGGTSELLLYDDGVAPDTHAGDGIFRAPFTVGNYTFDRIPAHLNLTMQAEVVDVLGKTATATTLLYITPPTLSKVGSGITYRNIGASGIISSTGYINLTDFSFRDTTKLDTDQVEMRVSSLTDPTKVWSALVSFANTGCSGPSITSIVLRVDGVAGNVTYTPSGGCFLIDADAKINLANVATSKDANGDTAAWTPVGTEATYQYSAAGIGEANEALIAFFGDAVSLSPFASGISQADFSWAPPLGAVTVSSAPLSLAGTPGNGFVDLSWSAPTSNGGSPITNYRIYKDGVFLAEIGTNTTFRVNGLTNGNSYDFTIKAVNAIGEGPASNTATVTPASVASAPQSLLATKGNKTVSLSWSAPASNGGSPITNYHIYMGTTSGLATYLGATGGSNTSFVVNGLTNGLAYFFNVTAQTSAGQGTTSAEGSATPSTIPEPPILTATAGNNKVTLTWTAGATGGSALTNYHLWRGASSGAATFLASTGSGANTSFVDESAVNGNTYYYNVTTRNANGESATSNEQSASPVSGTTAPSAPQSLVATRANNSVVLTWSAPSTDGGSAITNYKIYVGTSSGGATFLAFTGGSNTTFTVNGLTNGATYFFNVTAVNAVGESATSGETSAVPAGVPYPPASLVATRGNQSASLSWSAPANTGGLAITSYHVYLGTSSGVTTYLASTGGANTSFVVNGLTNGVTYFVNVTAQTAAGQSVAGSNEASVVPATVPNPPASLVATRGDTQVSLSWSTPANGGSAITAYKIYRGTSSGGETYLASIGTNTSFVAAGLTNGQVYYFNVTAVNAVGESSTSNEASATPATTPSAPQSLVATKGNTSVSLAWSAPASNNGAAVTAYHIYRGTTSGAATWIASIGTNTSFVANGLTNGQAYYFNVTAENSVGQGSSSAEASATPSTVPNPPASLVATANNSSVVISWSAPSNGGSAITGYKIYRGTSSGGETYLASIGTNTSFNSTGLTNGQIYHFNVTALNVNGESSTSNEASATPAAAALPPTSLGATGASGRVDLSWTASSNNGGSAITGHQIWRGTSPGSLTLFATIGTNTTFSDTNVVFGTTYYYAVKAVNGISASNPSNEANGSPTGSPPSAPTSLVGTPSNNRVALNWTTPSSSGSASLTGYKIYRNGTIFATIGTNVTFNDLTAKNNVTYTYHVVAYSTAGDSPASNTVTVAPSANIDLDCSTFVISAGALGAGETCSALQFGGTLANLTESGTTGSTKVAILDATMNVTGVSGTQTLEIRGERNQAGEDMLVQLYNPATLTYDTIVTLPGSINTQQTVSNTFNIGTYAVNGKLTIRIRDNGADSNQSSWIVDFVRLVTT